MTDFSGLPLEQLLEGFDCPVCGRRHDTELKIFRSGAGTVAELPDVLSRLQKKKPFVVCDANTYRAAGEKVVKILSDAGVEHVLFTFPHEKVEPDEWNVGSLVMNYEPSCDVLLAVGSGVINDVCKVAAHAIGIPSMVVGTAPSMDGYASNSSSMHKNEVKTTMYNACPIAIICDTDIVSQAPMRMLWSGLGDMIAKYVSICEWRIAHLIIDEYYCEPIAQLVRRSLAKCVENANRLLDRDPAVIQAVFEGLVLSGVAMSFAKNSRPASGMEHYFSHLWEMMAAERHRKADFHGIQVGVGTLLTLKLYDWVRTVKPDRQVALTTMAAFDQLEWEANIRRIFGTTAPQILAIEQSVHKNDPGKHAVRIDKIVEHWEEILRIIDEELPPAPQIEEMMRYLGMPMTPADLQISEQDAKDAFVGSREIRDKYIFSSMMWDMGLICEAAERVKAE